MTTHTSTATSDVELVQRGFAAVAAGDLAGFAAVYHPDATWNHRNPDRLGGVKHGVGEIVDFFAQSMADTAGTLKPMPELIMSDDGGHVAVLTRITGERPDGRAFDDLGILYLVIENGLVRSVDQFVGDPPSVTSFWA